MAKKKGLDELGALADVLVSPDEEDVDPNLEEEEDEVNPPIVDPSEFSSVDDEEDESSKSKDKDKDKSEEENEGESESEEEAQESEEESSEEEKEGEEDRISGESSEEVDDETLGKLEPDLVKYTQEKLYEKLGIDLEDDEKVESMDSFVERLEEIVSEASKPTFASEEIEKLNDFVESGGNLRNYFEARYSTEFDVEKVDLERQIDQERILHEFFKSQNIANDKIEARIQRYDDSGILKDEAESALEILKNMKEKNAKKLLEEQQNFMEEAQKEQQNFYNNVVSYIKSLKDINGIPLNNKQKEQLIRDIFVPNKDGVTKYQQEYESDLVTNLVKSAFYTLSGDKHDESIKRKAKSESVKEIRRKLEASKKNPRLKGTLVEESKKSSEDAVKEIASYLGVSEN